MAEAKHTASKADQGATSTFGTTGTPATADSQSLPLADRPALASESSDPAVHQLLAERDALRLNREQLDPPTDKDAVKAVDDKISQVDKQLADLGYPQQ